MKPNKIRKIRLKNDFDELSKAKNSFFEFEAIEGYPPYVEVFKLTAKINLIVNAKEDINDTHTFILTLPKDYPKTAPEIKAASFTPFHPNWYPDGKWCYGTWSINERITSFINRMLLGLQFVPDFVNEHSPSNSFAAKWYINHKYSGIFPTDNKSLVSSNHKMADIKIHFLHPTDGRKITVDVDITMTTEEIIHELIAADFIPDNRAGYTLAIKGGEILKNKVSLEEGNVQSGITIRIIPATDAGGSFINDSNTNIDSGNKEIIEIKIELPLENEIINVNLAKKMTVTEMIAELITNKYLSNLQKGYNISFKGNEIENPNLELKNLGIKNNDLIKISFSDNNSGINISSVYSEEAKKRIEVALMNNDKYLILSNLYLDNIPKEIKALKSIEKLILSYNYLEEIPKEIFELENLLELDLSSNKINNIPPDILKLENLRDIDLSNNSLDILPEELFLLRKLITLKIVNNPFKDKPEIKNKGFRELINLFNISNDDDIYRFHINISDDLKTAFQQYLLFFREYVFYSKKQKIDYDVNITSEGLVIETKIKEESEFEDIRTYLNEYLYFAKKNVVDSINFRTTPSIQEINLLKMNLELQVNNLNMQIQFRDWQINNLKENIIELKSEKTSLLNTIESAFQNTNKISLLKQNDLSSEELYNNCNNLIAKNKIENVLDILQNNLKGTEKNDILLIYNRWNNLKIDFSKNIIDYKEWSLQSSKLIDGLLKIIQHLKN